MSAEVVALVAEIAPVAKCLRGEWDYPPAGSFPSDAEVDQAAQQHARKTGHAVQVTGRHEVVEYRLADES